MQKTDLKQFKAWFAKYADSYFGDDAYINANLQLKKDHTARTCDEMDYLIDRLGLGAEDKLIAQAIALFHDVGRFPQFVKYNTYMDARSCDHCCLAVKILEDNEVLSCLPDDQQQLILTAIRVHGQKLLPSGLDERTSIFAKLIRDADKLDIFFLVIDRMKAYTADPDNFQTEVEFSMEPYCTKEVVQSVIDGKLINYNKLRTMNDMWLLQLGWVYDINFAPAFAKIKQQKYLEQISGYITKTAPTEKAIVRVLEYVDEHIADC